MLGSLHEAQDVLANRGVELDTKTVRLIAYRYAARARLAQQIDQAGFEDTVAGRRVVISSDGGRLRLRETKRGARTNKGRQRYTGAWREPKVLLVYVVDAEGKRDATFVPVMDATLKGPEAVFASRDGCNAQGTGGGVRSAPHLLATPRDHPGGPGPLYCRWS